MAVLFENFLVLCLACREKTARAGREKNGAGRTLRAICPCGASIQAGIATRAGRMIANTISHERSSRTHVAPQPASPP